MQKLKDLEKKSSKKAKQSIECFNRFVTDIPWPYAVNRIEYRLYPHGCHVTNCHKKRKQEPTHCCSKQILYERNTVFLMKHCIRPI